MRRRMARRLMGRMGGPSKVMRFAGVTTGMARGVCDLRLLSLWLLFTREVFGHFVSYRSGKSRLKIKLALYGPKRMQTPFYHFHCVRREDYGSTTTPWFGVLVRAALSLDNCSFSMSADKSVIV